MKPNHSLISDNIDFQIVEEEFALSPEISTDDKTQLPLGALMDITTEQTDPQIPITFPELVGDFDMEMEGAVVVLDKVKSVNGKIGEVILTKEDIDLDKVDNTADENKPVSILQQQAIDEVYTSAQKYIDEVTENLTVGVETYGEGNTIFLSASAKE